MQVEEQPSPLARFPSSQPSGATNIPSPQTVTQASPLKLGLYPDEQLKQFNVRLAVSRRHVRQEIIEVQSAMQLEVAESKGANA